MGEHHKRGGARTGASAEIWQNWRRTAPRTPITHAKGCSTGTSCRRSTIRSPAVARCRSKRSAWGWRATRGDLNPVAVLINTGNDRDPAKVRGGDHLSIPESHAGPSLLSEKVAGARLAADVRALRTAVDARRGRARRPPVPQSRDHSRDGERATGPEAVCRPELTVIAWVWARTVKTQTPRSQP